SQQSERAAWDTYLDVFKDDKRFPAASLVFSRRELVAETQDLIAIAKERRIRVTNEQLALAIEERAKADPRYKRLAPTPAPKPGAGTKTIPARAGAEISSTGDDEERLGFDQRLKRITSKFKRGEWELNN